MNLKEYYRQRLSNLLSEEKAKKKSLPDQSDIALGELEGLLSDAHERMQGSNDPRLAAHHKILANHFMDAYNHHMVGEYEQAIQVARRGIAAQNLQSTGGVARNPATPQERQSQWNNMYGTSQEQNSQSTGGVARNPATWEERDEQWNNMYGTPHTKN